METDNLSESKDPKLEIAAGAAQFLVALKTEDASNLPLFKSEEMIGLNVKTEFKTEDTKLNLQGMKIDEGVLPPRIKTDNDAKMVLDPNPLRIKSEERIGLNVKTEFKTEAEDTKLNLQEMKIDDDVVLPRIKADNDANMDIDASESLGAQDGACSTREAAMPCASSEVLPPSSSTNRLPNSTEADPVPVKIRRSADPRSTDFSPSDATPLVVVKKEPEEVSVGIFAASRPKRRRCFMDAVLVPSLKSLRIAPLRDIGASQPPLKKIKKLERSEGLGAGPLRARLIAAGIEVDPYPVELEADVRDISVRRDFMRIHYGGNSRAAFPAISEEWYTKTGHRYFMYPNLVQNPDSPMFPGAPGLFLDAAGRSARDCTVEWTSGTYKVLTRLGTNDNLYMGEYAIRPADSLTLEEWTAQASTMQNRWCANLAKKDWGRITRMRIALRRQLGRNPTFEEVKAAMESNRKFTYITSDDIAEAFNKGDEQLAVWTMECVGYDEQFQRDLVRQITGWIPPPRKTKAQKKSKTKKVVSTPRTKPTGRRSVTVESEDEFDEA
ncbi:hypothetical protein C8R44DRAFT_785533 [Mycena epipterygia]|nr:hypothetical protein C8R44DRAFT_785533 [Mycena epipterygia]